MWVSTTPIPGWRLRTQEGSNMNWQAPMDADVSVILPTFNRTRSLTAAVMSVLTQSYRNLELIVVDDGSTEDVEGLLRQIEDKRLRYIRRPRNGGAAAARNTGLAAATGRFIAFQDSDDIWLPGKLAKQIALFAQLPDHVRVVTGAKIVYGRDPSFNYGPARIAYAPPPQGRLTLEEDQLAHLLSENRISVQNALFRRDCFPEALWFDTCARANEDWDFAVRLSRYTTIYEDIEPVVLGFISGDSISSSSRKQTIGMIRILRKNRAALRKHKRQRSRMLIDLAIMLLKDGKTKRGMRFLLAGLADYPPHATGLALSLMRRVRRAFGKPSGQM